MADAKISALPAATTLEGNEEFPMNDGGTTRKITAANMAQQLQGMLPPDTGGGGSGTGTSGGAGATGATGPPGLDGVDGLAGTPGGATGATGSQGATGPPGLDGVDGLAGTPGGATGATGAAGTSGATGQPGMDGVDGSAGATGATGPGAVAKIGARIHNSTTQSITNATWTTVTYDTEDRDDGGLHSGSDGKLTAPQAGWYDIKGIVEFVSNTTGARGARLRLNGSTVIGQEFFAQVPQLADVFGISVETSYYLAASDYVELQVFQASTGLLNINGGQSTPYSMVLDEGVLGATGATGAAGATGSAGIDGIDGRNGATGATGPGAASFSGSRVYRTTTQSISDNTETALSFDTERYDTDAYHDNSTNPTRFTIPVTGKYSVGGTATFASLTSNLTGIALRLNGSTFIAYDTRSISGGAQGFLTIDSEYAFTAGDYAELVVYQNSGGPINILSAGSYSAEFWISKIDGVVGASGATGPAGLDGMDGRNGATGATGSSAADPVFDTLGSPDTAFEFDTSSLSGLTVVGSPDVEDANTTVPGAYFVQDDDNAWVGRYVAATAPFTVVTELLDKTYIATDGFKAGVFVGDSSPALSADADVLLIGNAAYGVWLELAASANITNIAGPYNTPMYLAIRVNSSTDVDYLFSMNGRVWRKLVDSRNPGIGTIATCGLVINGASGIMAAAYNYLRIWNSAKTFPGALA